MSINTRLAMARMPSAATSQGSTFPPPEAGAALRDLLNINILGCSGLGLRRRWRLLRTSHASRGRIIVQAKHRVSRAGVFVCHTFSSVINRRGRIYGTAGSAYSKMPHTGDWV